MMRDRKHQHGVTAIELMVVVVIAAILATIAIPSFSDLIARRKVEGLANELSADIQYARAEAISRNADVSVSVSKNDGSYTIARGTDTIKTVAILPSKTTLTPGTVTFTAFRGLTSDDSDLAFTVGSETVDNELQITLNELGRTEICAPGTAWGGYALCAD